jgi:hypothetical protein
MESNASVHGNKDLFNSLSQKPKINDLNELMLKYVLELNPKQADKSSDLKKESTNNQQTVKSQNDLIIASHQISQDSNNNLVTDKIQVKTNSPNKSQTNGLQSADIDFFCNQQTDSWAKFDDHFFKPNYKVSSI